MTSKNTATILLVEDNDIDAEAVRRAFARMNIENPVLLATDGKEALEILRGSSPTPSSEQPILTLLDLNMPRMNGLEFLGEIRSDAKFARHVVFVLTTSGLDLDKEAAYDLGISGYMMKDKLEDGFKEFATFMGEYLECMEFPPAAQVAVV